MAVHPIRLLSPSFLRAVSKSAPALIRARKEYVEGDAKSALASFEEFLAATPDLPPDYQAFHAALLVLNHRSADAARLYKELLVHSNHRRQRVRYAAAVAGYYLALIEEKPDALERWHEARALQPTKGEAWKYYGLPDVPLTS
jgi:tetratricopeptide (TPR) repeat protein